MKVCPICSNTKLTIEDKELSIFHCKPCNHRFNQNTQNLVKEHYEKNYVDENKNFFKYPNYKLYEHILKNLPKKQITLMDISCGNGTFLKYALNKRNKIKLYGIDLRENKHKHITFIQADIFEAKINKKFDVIIGKDIIDHVKNIRLFMQLLKNLLKEDGIIFLTITDSDTISYKTAQLIKPIWKLPYKLLHRPYVLNYFTLESLKRLFELEELKIIGQKHYSPPLMSIDIPHKNFILQKIHKALAMCIFSFSSIIKQNPYLLVLCKKQPSKHG